MKRPPEGGQKSWQTPDEGGRTRGATRVHSKALRLRIGRSEILETSRWLTKRDLAVCNDVYEHKVLTASQVRQIHFNNMRGAERRLLRLYERQVLDRFRPRASIGSAPFHYVLGELGAYIIAGDRGLDMKAMRERRKSDLKLPYSRRLPHLIEVNEFFASLALACRHSNNLYWLRRWWNESRCRAACHDVVRPDALGELKGSSGSCTFLFELDRGTERGDRLTQKLRAYEWLARIKKDVADSILFLFHGRERELRARTKLDLIPGLAVASTHSELFYADPLGPVWLPLETERRVALVELPRHKVWQP